MSNLYQRVRHSLSCVSNKSEFLKLKNVDKEISRQLKIWQRDEDRVVKLLLLGTGESGKSTVTKQMKIIHINGFSDSERRDRIRDIRKNIRDSILCILGGMNHLGIDLEDPKLTNSVQYLMTEATCDHFTYPKEFFEHTIKLWDDAGVQDCYLRSHEYQLIDCAKYFLDKCSTVEEDDYLPTDQDILRCRVMTNTIQNIDFCVKDGKNPVTFRVFDVGGQQGERRKWIQVFDAMTAILFIVDCSSFDLVLREDTTRNRLLEAITVFEQVWNNRYLQNVSIILFINKIDVLEEKINNGRRLDTLVDSMQEQERYYQLFQEYKTFTKPKETERREFLEAFPGGGRIQTTENGKQTTTKRRSRSMSIRTDMHEEVIRTAVFVKRLFLELVDKPRKDAYGSDWHDSHNCEYYYTCAVDTENIQKVLEGCRNLIIKKHLARWISIY